MPGADFRDPSSEERAVLDKLIDHEFVGAGDLKDQLAGLRVRAIDPEGSLELAPSEGARAAEVEERVPVEAEMKDRDGITIHVLLHVVEGLLNELEIYREDLGSPQRDLDADALRVFSL